MALTPAQLKGRIKNITSKNNADARMRDFYDVFTLMKLYGNDIDNHVLNEAFKATSQKRNSTFEHIDHQLEKLAGSTELQKLWKQYQRKFAYAADISFNSVMDNVNTLVQKAVF